MKILAIDIAIKNTGYAILENRKVLSTERFITDAQGYYTPEFLIQHETKLNTMLNSHKPDLVVIEGSALGARNYQFSIGAVFGLLTKIVYERKIPTFILPPMTWKFVFTGRGDATKARIREVVDANFELPKTQGKSKRSQDEYDAVGMGFVGYLAVKYKQQGFKSSQTAKFKKVFIGESGLLNSPNRAWFIDSIKQQTFD